MSNSTSTNGSGNATSILNIVGESNSATMATNQSTQTDDTSTENSNAIIEEIRADNEELRNKWFDAEDRECDRIRENNIMMDMAFEESQQKV